MIYTWHDKGVNAVSKRIWRAGDMSVWILADDAWTNCYFVRNRSSGEVFAVDPYWINLPLEGLRRCGVSKFSEVVTYITHPHPDHLEGITDLRETGYTVTVVAHERVAELLDTLCQEKTA